MPSCCLLIFPWVFIFFLLTCKNFYKMRILTIIYHICCYFFPVYHLSFNFLYSFFFFFNIYLFIWLHRVLVAARGVLVAARGILVAACGIFSCGMWDLVPWPGIKPGPPELGARSLSHWTTREVPSFTVSIFHFKKVFPSLSWRLLIVTHSLA